MNSFNKILIANRGEIAVRVIRTAKNMGYRTVAVYSEADAQALHVTVADQAVCIGAAPVGESYLVIEKLLDAARRTGADAIHPGYGFLSENADFARACEHAGITFIGPSPEAIELMGDKRQAKIAMLKARVPCIPGYQDSDQSDTRLLAEAKKTGFPLMVKASAGGGGRGMRLVTQASEIGAAIKTARSEAQSAFGNGDLILEKAMIEARHIEIQVFADSAGNTVYLGERDCSIQRRHQKVVEEAPSPAVDEQLRQRMGEAAVNAAKACHYRGAGTVEFLLDKDKQFYFLEMNTRLQVEHPVTELITGLDLVAWQLKVAAGESLPLQQQDITLNGHAIEVRLYAEDSRRQFMPQTGQVLHWAAPDSAGVRIDHGISTGQHISSHYDPMLAKIIACGDNRAQARRRLTCALEDTVLLGITTNKTFLTNILRHPVFVQGDASTDFIQQHFSNDPSMKPGAPCAKALALAAIILYTHSAQHHSNQAGWHNGANIPCHYLLSHEDKRYPVKLLAEKQQQSIRFSIDTEGEQIILNLLSIDAQRCLYNDQGVRESIAYTFDSNRLFLNTGSGNSCFIDATHAPPDNKQHAGTGSIVASMDGTIVEVLVSEGNRVTRGQTLVVLEAMKMEHPLKADADGLVESIKVKAGDQVKHRQLLSKICIANQEETNA